MPLSPEKQARLDYLNSVLGPIDAAPSVSRDRPSFLSRLGQGFANVPSNIAGGLANAGINIANYGQIPEDRLANVNVPKPYDLPPAQDWSESLADVIPGLTAAVGTAMIPGGAVARGAQALGMGSTGAAILGDVAGGAVLGAGQSPGEAAGTATEFGALGAANRFLPNPWLKVAANAAIPFTGQLLRGRDPTSRESLISMGANVIAPALLGQYARRGGTRTGEDLLRPPTAEETAVVSTPPEPGQQQLLSPQYQHGGSTAPPERIAPHGRPTPQAGVETPPRAFEDVAQDLMRYRPPEMAANPLPQEFSGDYPLMRRAETAAEVPLPREISPSEETASAIREPIVDVPTPNPEPSGRPMRQNPKYFEFAGIDPSNPLLQYGAGAIAGGVINPILDQDPEHSLLRKVGEGALRGIGLTAAAKGIRNIPYIARKMQVDLGVRQGRTQVEPFDRAQALRKQMGDVAAARSVGLTEAHVEDFMLGTNKTGINPYGMGETGLGMEMAKRMEGAPPVPATKVSTTPAAPGSGDTAGAIRQAYEGLVRQTRFPAVRISDLARDSGVPVPQVQEYLRAQARQGKVALEGGDWSLASDAERAASIRIGGGTDPRDVMLLARFMDREPSGGMGLIGVKMPPIRDILRRKAAEQERDPEGFLQAPGKYAARALETQFNLGKPDNLTFAQERGKGDANLLRQEQEPARIGLLRAQTEDPSGYKAAQEFLRTKREPADVSLLRANAMPETAKAAMDYSDTKIKGQKVLFDATGNPMYTSTPEYQGGFYEAFSNPKEWRKKLATDPSMKGDLTNALIRDNVIPGAERWEVEQAVDGFAKGTIAGQEFEGQSNAAKISRHLTEHKKDLTPEYRKFLGEYTDPVQREILTVHKLIGSVAQARTISVLDEMGGIGKMPGGEDKLPIFDRETRRAEYAKAQASGDTARMEELGDLVQVPENTSFGKLSGKFVPRSVSDALNAQREVWQGGWMRGMSGATSWMKQALTLYNPGTHGRQILQIPMAAAIARVAPWDFWPAMREWKNNAAMREEILRNHISGADISSQDLRRGALEMDSTFNPDAKDRALSKVTAFHRTVQKIYGLPDNLVRITAYIKNRPRFFAEGNAKGLKGEELQSYTERETTKWVNNHTMNYGIVPNIVKIGRETPFVSPFVSYQQQMLKLLTVLGQDAISGSGADRAWALGNLGMLIGGPLILAAHAKGQLSPADQQEWNRIQKLSPAYSGGQIRVPLGKNKDGTFRYLNIANLVPAGDTAALARNLANGDGERLFASNPFIGWEKSPILNTIAQQVKGRENVTDRKLETPVDRGRALLKEVLPPLTPYIGYEAQRIGAAFTPNAEGGLGLTNARTGRSDTPGTALLRQAGIPLSDVKLQPLLRRAQSDFREEKAIAGMELRQTRDTNATPAARQKAQDKYLATVREKQRQLLERIR